MRTDSTLQGNGCSTGGSEGPTFMAGDEKIRVTLLSSFTGVVARRRVSLFTPDERRSDTRVFEVISPLIYWDSVVWESNAPPSSNSLRLDQKMTRDL
jgi:hypothetical protein